MQFVGRTLGFSLRRKKDFCATIEGHRQKIKENLTGSGDLLSIAKKKKKKKMPNLTRDFLIRKTRLVAIKYIFTWRLEQRAILTNPNNKSVSCWKNGFYISGNDIPQHLVEQPLQLDQHRHASYGNAWPQNRWYFSRKRLAWPKGTTS